MLKRILMGIVMLMAFQSSLEASASVPTKAEVTKLYVASFKRAPDAGGLQYWFNEGITLKEIAKYFFDSSEMKEAYPPSSSTEDFVEAVYLNLFNRADDPEGVAYWANEIDLGHITRAELILFAIDTDDDHDAAILDNKTEVCLAYVDILGDKTNIVVDDPEQYKTNPAYLASIKIISEVTEDRATVECPVDFLDSIVNDDDPIGRIIDDLSCGNGVLDFTMILDANESTVIVDWKVLSNFNDEEATATVLTQGEYGTFVITDGSLAYLKTKETNKTDIGMLEISNGDDTVEVTVRVNSLYWRVVSAGHENTVAIKSDGTLWSWGNNKYGQLGDGTTADRLVSTQEASKATNWISIAAGYTHTLAIKSDGTLWAWGNNSTGQLGDGTTTNKHIPTQEATGASDWSSINAGRSHTTAIKSDGTLWAWGHNWTGQLGDGTTTNKHIPTQEATGASDWSSINAGGSHTTAIKSDGTLWAWGYNEDGQLGDGTSGRRTVPTQESTNATNWSSAHAAEMYTTAIKSDGTLWAWGFNDHGQLGDGTTIGRYAPTQEYTEAVDWRSVSMGLNHTTAIKSDGTLWAWGHNHHRQLGDGTQTNRLLPTQEDSQSSDWSSLSSGSNHTIAIKSNGTLWVWGYNTYGAFGNGTSSNKAIPNQEFTKAINWSSVATGKYHTVAIKNDGTLWAWGWNGTGQIGDGTTTQRLVPTQEVTNAKDWISVSAGESYTVGIKSDGTLWAWGANSAGQLGDGTTTTRLIPTQEFTKSTNWDSISAKFIYTIAIKSDGTLWAWGYNYHGQLGDGTTTNKSVPTQENTKATDWLNACAGDYYHTVALKSNGALWAWGENYHGELGDGTNTDRLVPTQEVTQATNWISVNAGHAHTIAIKNDGTLWAWGYNYHGQLGDGTGTNRSVPTQESTGSTDWSIANARNSQSMAIKSNGTLWAWGHNWTGQLGNATRTDKLSPTQEATLSTNWNSISAGAYFSVAIKLDGTLWAWGENWFGQLGDNSQTWIPTQSQP